MKYYTDKKTRAEIDKRLDRMNSICANLGDDSSGEEYEAVMGEYSKLMDASGVCALYVVDGVYFDLTLSYTFCHCIAL